ncbi:MAG: hypothetical protein ACREJ6_04260 [Candidatus Methylomirabilis sp.]
MRVVFLLLLLLLPLPLSVQADDLSSHKIPPDKLLQPMNVPMDELGVTGHDTTLCSDRWYTCSSYDRQQFDQKYIGVPLNELLRYGEPDWPSGERERRGGSGSHDSLNDHDRPDKD